MLDFLFAHATFYILAQDGAITVGGAVDALVQGGPFAIVLLLIVADKLAPTGERNRLREDNVRLVKELKDLNLSIRRDVVPALVQATALMQQLIADWESVEKDNGDKK